MLVFSFIMSIIFAIVLVTFIVAMFVAVIKQRQINNVLDDLTLDIQGGAVDDNKEEK